MTQYFLYANTEKKPIFRFFDHWFEVNDFIGLMKWDLPDAPLVEIYKRMTDDDVKDKT